MKILSISFAIMAAFVGWRAAILWNKSSKIEIIPLWKIEPGDALYSEMGWQAGIMGAVKKSAEFNKEASNWTKWAVVFSVLSSILSNL